MHVNNLFRVIIFFLSLFIFSCNTSEKDNKTDTDNDVVAVSTVEDFNKIEVEIDGMTCEIGCAKLIESKLSKIDGVKYVNVNFEEKLGKIEYDTHKINKNEITDVIQNIAGGDLYKVVKIENVDKF